jgi:hypothetical protein
MSRGTRHYDMEVTKVASVRQLSRSQYQVMVTGTELALIRAALAEAERVSRFGMEVLDEVDNSHDGEPVANSRLREEIDALAMREASLRSLQKTMAEVDRGAKLPSRQHAGLDQMSARAALPVPRPR